MDVVCWDPHRALGVPDPAAADELDGVAVLLLEDVTNADDDRLRWTTTAPCVVAAVGSGPPSVDVVVAEADVDRLVERVVAHPAASRALVEVLRVVPALPIPEALTVESLAYSLLLTGSEFSTWRNAQPHLRPKSFDAPPVRVRRDDGELRLTLARPENRNAFSAAMRDAVLEALAVAELDRSVTRVVIEADGPTFSSGGDLSEFGTSSDAVRAHQIRMLRNVAAAIARLGPKVTAVVHGACVGAGVELSSFAGRVVADRQATFRLPEVEMGLIPGAGGTVGLTRRIGRHRTALLALLGDAIDAETGLRWGLVDELSGTA